VLDSEEATRFVPAKKVSLEELKKRRTVQSLDRSHLVDSDYVVASEGYFAALGIPLLRGRLFDERDIIDAPHVAPISQSLAAERWPNEDPIGRTIEFGNMDGDLRLLTIVGVVGDIRDHSLEAAPRPTICVNYRQRPQSAWSFTVVLFASGSPDSVFAAARAALRDLDPNIPRRFRTLSQVYSASLEARRFSLTLIGVFSVAALLLALAGIYGVISYSVAQRTHEIGVRKALGASTREVLRMIPQAGSVDRYAWHFRGHSGGAGVDPLAPGRNCSRSAPRIRRPLQPWPCCCYWFHCWRVGFRRAERRASILWLRCAMNSKVA
jgi:MacB-like periplasmic core domain